MWRTNASIEPLQLVLGNPIPEAPNLLIPPILSAAKLERMRNIIPNPESTAYWNNILQGGLGTDREAVISPSFKSPHVQLKRENGEVDNSADLQRENFGEEDILGFGDLEWNQKLRQWELQVDFENEDEKILCTRDCFFDADGTATELFLKWENEHPKLAKRFVSQKPPKEKSQHMNEKKRKKKKIKKEKDASEKHSSKRERAEEKSNEITSKKSKKDLGRILQDGRGGKK